MVWFPINRECDEYQSAHSIQHLLYTKTQRQFDSKSNKRNGKLTAKRKAQCY
jgi:hypothetical protein